MFDIIAVLLFQDSVVCVLVQVDKDFRHSLLLEQPSLHAAISSWHSDFELQEIFRKGKTQPSPVFMLLSFAVSVSFLWRVPRIMLSFLGTCSNQSPWDYCSYFKCLNLAAFITSVVKTVILVD